ncbi:MAG: site-specific DNA-methyltransferase [Pirellulaceae bacterium]|nr:site-specific DNA-methyltransferase [Pirellulaceae bacterium]
MEGIMDRTYRRISDASHNEFVANGVETHTPTSLAPTSLLQPISEVVSRRVADAQRRLESKLSRVAGSPFYSAPGVLLYNTDCVPFLAGLAGLGISVDLTVTSPPYNIGKEYESRLSVEDYVAWCQTWMCSIHSATKPDGTFWLNVGYLEVPEHGLCVPIPYLLWDKSPFYLLQEVVWKYGAGVSARRRLSPRNEKWLYYVKEPHRYTFNLDEIRDPNVKYPNQKKGGKFRCNPFGKNPSDVWEFPKVTTGTKRSSRERTGHPAQFPLPVVERIVRASSNPAEVVLDPFAGSCSAGVAAAGLGRLFVGCEISEDYCKLAAERFESYRRARSQCSLF